MPSMQLYLEPESGDYLDRLRDTLTDQDLVVDGNDQVEETVEDDKPADNDERVGSPASPEADPEETELAEDLPLQGDPPEEPTETSNKPEELEENKAASDHLSLASNHDEDVEDGGKQDGDEDLELELESDSGGSKEETEEGKGTGMEGEGREAGERGQEGEEGREGEAMGQGLGRPGVEEGAGEDGPEGQERGGGSGSNQGNEGKEETEAAETKEVGDDESEVSLKLEDDEEIVLDDEEIDPNTL
jgi:hypothetical protein